MIAWAAPAPAGDVALDPESIWKLQSIQDAQIHPDGTSVVYVVQRNDPATDRAYSNLRQAATDHSFDRALTSGNYRDTEPRWSPDGKRLAFLSDRGGRTQIHVLWLDSGKESVIAAGQDAPSRIGWSPDGKRIAFLRFVPSAPAWNPAMPKPPNGAKWAEAPRVVTQLRWIFDGIGVLRNGGDRMFVVPAAGGRSGKSATSLFTTHRICFHRSSPGSMMKRCWRLR